MPLRHRQDNQPAERNSPAPQRLTAEEARDVVALWGRQQEIAGTPTLADVAEALDIETGPAERLLVKVRARQRPRRWLRRLAFTSVVAALVGVVGIGTMCETVGGFASYRHTIYRPIPVAHWGFGENYQPAGDVRMRRYGFISVQQGDPGPNEVHFFCDSGGDPFP